MSDVTEVGELRRQLARLRLLGEAVSELSRSATPQQVADVAVAQFDRLLGTSSVAVFELRDGDSLDAMTLGGWAEGAREAWTTMPLDAPAPVAEAARTEAPVWSESPLAWRSRYPHLLEMLDGYGYSGVLGLPLVSAGELIGAIGIGFTDERTLQEDERTAVSALGDQCAQALQRARLLLVESEARQAAERLTVMVAALSRSRTPGQVTAAIGEAATALGASASVVAVRSGEDRLDLLGTTAPPPSPPWLPLTAAHPLAYAVRTAEPVWLARRSRLAWQDRGFADSPIGPATDVAVPMFLDDRTVGAIGMSFAEDPPHYSPEERRAIVTLAGQCAQALDRARLQQVEHEIAETLQRSLLPDRLPELKRLSFAARYLPGAEGTRAGGDWYDVVELDGSRVAVVVGDVVGKGPSAAALMGQLRVALAAALLRGDGPAAALRQLDRFCTRVPAARASTAACVLLDWASGSATCASAGHPVPLLITATGARLLEVESGPALGLTGTRAEQFTDAQLTLEPGATLLLYTDGLVESPEQSLDQGLTRLVNAAAGRADQPPAEAVDDMLKELLDDVGPADDVAVIAARLVPAPYSGRLPARPEELRMLRRRVADWSQDTGLDVDQTDDLQFALGEAVANSVEHAYRDRESGHIEVSLERRGDGAVQVTVTDTGSWRPPPEDPGYRGRGLTVIRAVATDVDIEPGAAGTRVAFRVPTAPAGATRHTRRRDWSPRPVHAEFTATRNGAEVVVTLTGEIDLAGAGLLRDSLERTVGETPEGVDIVLDLRETHYLASAGVALLLDTVDQARERNVAVAAMVRPDSAVARLLDLTGVGALLGQTPAGP